MRTKEEWARLIAAQKASNLSGAEWCRKNNVRENQFFYWRKALEGQSEKQFVRIGGDRLLEICFLDGVRISVPADFDEASLKRLVGVLRA